MGLFGIIKKCCSKSAFVCTPKELPIFIVSGADDPVGAYGKGVKKVYNKYRAAGVKDLSLKLYNEARHEILNDDCAEEACADIFSFIFGRAQIK